MCFSATASFVSSGVLAAAGGASSKMANKNERLLAAMPLLFAVQQAIEGLQWLAPHPSMQSQLLGYAYLFFAFLLWPTYFPLAVYQMETHPRHKKILRYFLGLGIFVSIGLLITLIALPLSLPIQDGHIWYNLPVSNNLVMFGLLLYSIAIVGSPMASSLRAMKLFGFAVLIAEIATIYLYWSGFTSVWCFFSAILSAGICVGLYLKSKK